MKAILFENAIVEIDPASTRVGGSWQGTDANGTPISWETEPVKFFYERTLEYDNAVIVDVGANTGTFCLLPAINPRMKVFAFEPAPHICELLEKNVACNGLADRVAIYNIALADQAGTTTLKFPRSGKDSGLACIGNPLRFSDWVEIDVPTTTLDVFVQQQRIEKVDLIKIDTEGCELFVLLGAERVIKRDAPGILLEYHAENTRQFGYEPEKIVELLSSWGYDQVTRASSEDFFFAKSSARISSTGPASLRSPLKPSTPKLSVPEGNAAAVNSPDAAGSPLRRLSRLAGFTLFTTPKALRGHIAVIQRNAIKSWLRLEPRPEVILLGNEEGVAQTASEFGLIHLPQIACNEYGTPLVSSIFETAQARAVNDLMSYVNTDIILFQDFPAALALTSGAQGCFLMAGRRYDIDVWDDLDLSREGAVEELKARARSQGILHGPTGIDYFAFRRGLYLGVLPFAVGRTAWDNWLIWFARSRGAALVDATRMVFAVHQEHDYNHAGGGVVNVWNGAESRRNRELAGPHLLDLGAAQFALEGERLVPAREATFIPSPTDADFARLKLHQAGVALGRGLTKQCADLLDFVAHMTDQRPQGLQLIRAQLAIKEGAFLEARAALQEELARFPESAEGRAALAFVNVAVEKEKLR